MEKIVDHWKRGEMVMSITGLSKEDEYYENWKKGNMGTIER